VSIFFSALRAVEPHVELPALAGEVPESTEARGARNLGPKKYHNCFYGAELVI
jgi:hypothetical protein